MSLIAFVVNPNLIPESQIFVKLRLAQHENAQVHLDLLQDHWVKQDQAVVNASVQYPVVKPDTLHPRTI